MLEALVATVMVVPSGQVVPSRGTVPGSHGMMILDQEGYERFGVGLMDNGQMAMGFDAPRGKGSDKNRERIHIVADPEGGAMIRFLNRKTSVPGWLRLGEDDNLYLPFYGFGSENYVYLKGRVLEKRSN